MAEKLFMIALSPTMTEGTLARWKVAEGQPFKAGSVLCEVETDKASMDYEAPKDGVLLKVLLAEGGRAAVGDVIGIIGKAGESPDALLAQLSSGDGGSSATASLADSAAASKAPGTPAPAGAAPASPAASPAAPAASVSAAAPAPAAPGPGGPAPSSPLARVLAVELGVDIRAVRGTGPGGRVVKRDVEAAAAGGPAPGRAAASAASAGARPGAAPSAAPVPRGPAVEQSVRVEPVAGKRAVIARRLSESFFSAPHYYLKRTVDAGRLLALRAALADPEGRKPSINALLARLAAAALAGHPAVNAGWKDEGAGKASVEYRSRVDIGLAVALPDGLITPVVRDCGAKGIVRIDEEMAALIAKAKGPGLSPEEYTGATFTITNLGGFGVEEFTAIINPPGSAILAVGAALDEPVAMPDGTVAVRKRMRLTLGCDHRVIDGAVGAAFLKDLAGMIEEPGRALA